MMTRRVDGGGSLRLGHGRRIAAVPAMTRPRRTIPHRLPPMIDRPYHDHDADDEIDSDDEIDPTSEIDPDEVDPEDEIDLDDELDLDEEFPLGDGTADTGAQVLCPYCGEENEIVIDPGGGASQQYVEDCQVCCQPWRVTITYRGDGTADAQADALDR